MCGIAGALGPAPPELVPAMLKVLEHRGPDDRGLSIEPGVALGMTRLAIIDLATGQQPVGNEDGSVRLVMNGEIYNFRVLRRLLEALGHRFRSAGDAEVIVHAYEEFGEACVERLDGMFAFALWDGPARRLLLARDRLGKKPLFYWRRGDLFLFASEIKALLCHAGVRRAVDAEALHHYLAFGVTPGERSIFADIRKLPAAHTAIVTDGTLAPRRYWALPPGAAITPIRREDALRAVRHEVREAVRARLESDVPLGVFLSGGIDSSTIVAAVREATGQRIATFSVGFSGEVPGFDELPFARSVARRFDTDHHEEILEPDVAETLPAMVAAFDEPFADSSAIPTYLVASAAARRLKVALSGIGGDETFAGYPRYLGLRLSLGYARLPRIVRRLPAVALRAVPAFEGSRNWCDRIRRFATGAEQRLPERYVEWTRFFGDGELAALVVPDLAHRWHADVTAARAAAFADRGHDDPVDGAFRIDLATYVPDDLLVMADRMAMAHSLEVRAPFCDHHLVEQSLRIAPALKLPGWRLKGLLKAAFADVLPPDVLAHPKHGFMIPLGRWLRTTLRPLMEELLAPERVRRRGLFVPAAVERLKREHLERRASHGDRLWTLMVAELWTRQYLDGDGREKAVEIQ